MKRPVLVLMLIDDKAEKSRWLTWSPFQKDTLQVLSALVCWVAEYFGGALKVTVETPYGYLDYGSIEIDATGKRKPVGEPDVRMKKVK